MSQRKKYSKINGVNSVDNNSTYSAYDRVLYERIKAEQSAYNRVQQIQSTNVFSLANRFKK